MTHWKLITITLTLLLGVILVGLLVASWFFQEALSTHNKMPVRTINDLDTYQTGNIKLRDLAQLATSSQECVLTFVNETYREGTAFIKDYNLRSDIIVENGAVINLVLVEGQAKARSFPPASPLVTPELLLDEVILYRCWPWVADMSVFAL